MPYSVPAQGRPGHRRSFSNIVPPPSLASTSTTGAFASLGALPTRRRPTRPTFQLGRDDDDDSPDESPEDGRPTKLTINTNLNDDDERGHLPPLRLKTKLVSSFDKQLPAQAAAAVPFPRSSPLPSPTISDKRTSPEPRSARPSVSRTSSTPILLANGKPLKSSLKSSSSSPNIPFPPQSMVPSIMFPQLHHPTHHQRACSAPATPNLDPLSPNPSASSSPSPQSLSPLPQKNVHFPSQEDGGLTTVRVYKRSAKPASLFRKGDETETETEGESSSAPIGSNLPWGSRWNHTGNGRAAAYPIPKFGGGLVLKKHSPLAGHHDSAKEKATFEIDMKNSSPIPARGAERAEGNIFFESLGLVSEATAENLAKPLTLTGTILVRNISYHKTIAVRYTLDDWNTTNDILAHHEKSLVALPERFLLASLPLIEDAEYPEGEERRREVVSRPRGFDDVEGGGALAWDRFRFEISLERYEGSIQQRTMWCVGKYSTASPAGGGGSLTPVGGDEWWDNNSGNNYRVSFLKKVVEDQVEEPDKEKKQSAAVDPSTGYRRNLVFSAPPVFTPSKPFPAPPQISSSVSYPLGTTAAQREQAAARHAALTQRLKNFGLTNYAAPSPASILPSPTASKDEQDDKVSPSETSTAETSADSTPMQTPTQDDTDGHSLHFVCKSGHDVNTNVLVHDDELGRDDEEESTMRWGLRGGLQMQDGYPATIAPMPSSTAMNVDDHDLQNTEEPTPPPTTSSTISYPMDIGKGRGRAAIDHESSVLEPIPAHILSPGPEMSTSPPFSLLAGMELRNGMFASKERPGLHLPLGAEGEEQSQETTPTRPNIVAPIPTHVTPNGAHIRASSSPLPQRKKAHHSLNQVPTFSIGRSSSSSSKSGSSGGSGSGSGSDTTSGRSGASSRPKLLSPQPWPLPPQNQLRRVMSPPPPGLGARRIFEFKAEDDNEAVVGNEPPSQSPPRNASPTELPASPSNDAVYQAFVRQWCFAQGPAPTVGAGPPAKSEKMRTLTPDVVVR